MKTNSKITHQKDKTFILSFTVTTNEIDKEYQHTLAHVASDFETKGFRKGKAPLNVVKAQISPEKMLDEVVNHLLSEKYDALVKEHQLKPATQPQVVIKNPPFDLSKDWQIEITSAQIPEITIKSTVFDEIKKINQDTKLSKDQKTDNIMKIILDNSQVEIAKIIIDNEIERKLTNLVDQIQKAGLTFDAYLKNKNQTLDQLRHELEHQSHDEWTLNLAISEIATQNKLDPTEAQIKDILTKNPQLSQNPSLVIYLLTQQNVINYLLSL